jgi:hypothetical protein
MQVWLHVEEFSDLMNLYLDLRVVENCVESLEQQGEAIIKVLVVRRRHSKELSLWWG